MRNIIGCTTVVVMVALAGCAHGKGTFPLSGSSIVPAATGMVTLKENKDSANKVLHISVQHLARPENLPREALGENGGATQTYVVWLQPMGNSSPDNIGVLMPDKNLNAELTTMTTQSRFDVFVTPEPSSTQTAPTGQHVLHAVVAP
jgi:hypothetical protein